jgi:hypothetical protein
MSEELDNKEIIGNWVTFIAETDKGYMLGFRTNNTRLEDIHDGAWFVADYFDIFDPINNGSPMLFPVEMYLIFLLSLMETTLNMPQIQHMIPTST